VAGTPTIEDLYRDHSPAVYAFLISLCRDRVWAEDLMQDTFAKATRSLAGYRGGSPTAWLFAIARSVFIDDVRKRRPEPTDITIEAPTSDPDVAEIQLIEEALAGLPERQRTALLLADHAGMPYAEIADTLGATTGAVKVLIHRARVGFRKGYEEASA
jgi:RNA polymerase sigma factor (sigma-70 family)